MPITNIAHVKLDDLVGYELAKQKLIDNTEALSLVYRFGVSIYFGAPTKKEFQQIVVELAEKQGVHLPAEELLAEANKWELSHGGLSGRTAQQFINYMLGQEV